MLYPSSQQLPPVGDTPLYRQDVNTTGGAAGFNLYRHFKKTIFFDVVQRQAGDGQQPFRDELKRLGNGEFTERDWEKWCSRNLDLLPHMERLEFQVSGLFTLSYLQVIVTTPFLTHHTLLGRLDCVQSFLGYEPLSILCHSSMLQLKY